MTLNEFRRRAASISTAELRCEIPPTEAVLELMDEVGLNRYERYVLKVEESRRNMEQLQSLAARICDSQPLK